eukprot:144047-Prorocentrum_minimum.AAC.1
MLLDAYNKSIHPHPDGDPVRAVRVHQGGGEHRVRGPAPQLLALLCGAQLGTYVKVCFTGINWKIVSTCEPKIMLTNSPT